MELWDLDKLVSLAAECGKIALDYYEQPGFSVKTDESIVTDADHAIEGLLSEALNDPDGGAYLIGEETVESRDGGYVSEAFRHSAWIVDPIDGTAPYSHHIPTWGISIGLMEHGALTNGLVYLPVTRELFITSGEDVLYAAGFSPETTASKTGFVTITNATPHIVSPELQSAGMIAITQNVAKSGAIDLPNPVQALGCAVMPLTYLLLGRYLAYIGTVKLWDIAGAVPMLERAGFTMQLDTGATLQKEVSEDAYRLRRDDPNRWKLRGRLFAAAGSETLAYVKRGLRKTIEER